MSPVGLTRMPTKLGLGTILKHICTEITRPGIGQAESRKGSRTVSNTMHDSAFSAADRNSVRTHTLGSDGEMVEMFADAAANLTRSRWHGASTAHLTSIVNKLAEATGGPINVTEQEMQDIRREINNRNAAQTRAWPDQSLHEALARLSWCKSESILSTEHVLT